MGTKSDLRSSLSARASLSGSREEPISPEMVRNHMHVCTRVARVGKGGGGDLDVRRGATLKSEEGTALKCIEETTFKSTGTIIGCTVGRTNDGGRTDEWKK